MHKTQVSFHYCVCTCSCPYLTTVYSVLIAIYQGILTMYVVVNFGLATFMDPGVYPKGNVSFFCVSILIKFCFIFTVIYAVIWCPCLCVCASACLSVTLRYSVRMATRRIMQIMPHDSQGTLRQS